MSYKDIKILIIGTDINAYYMARCYHELTGNKANLIGKVNMAFTSVSNITNIELEPNLWETDAFVNVLIKHAKENIKGKEKILLVGCNDNYVRLIVENRKKLEKYYIFNYPSLEIVNNVLIKENFYTNYKNMGLDMPLTYFYKCKNDNIKNIKKIFKEYPLIIKPSDGIEYHSLKIDLDKVYKVKSEKELENTIKKIESAGYTSNLIIQEFIPGDDSGLFDSLFYCGKDKKAKLATFAQIGLQEHTPSGIGNCTVLVNGFDEHGYKEEVVNKLKDFMNKIGYQGFAEFDMKYDPRDKKYKVLEINPRQSRSGYYMAACGYNLVKTLIDDLLYNQTMNFTIIKEKHVLSFVPKKVIFNYVYSEPLKKEIKSLIKNKKLTNPLVYKKDLSLKRRKYMFMRSKNYIKKYKKYTF